MLLSLIALASVAAALLIGWSSGSFGSWQWIWVVPVSIVGSFLVLLLLAFGFLWLMCHFVDQDKPQERDSRFYRALTNLYIDAVKTGIRLRVHTEGLEHTPRDGRFLLVCNHMSDADPAILLAYFKKSQIAFISKQENRSMFLVGPLMHKIMCQLLNRENDREALKTILKCIQLLKEDVVSVGVFPEGYESKDGRLHHFRSGVFKIAQKANVPIVVCTLKNTKQIFRNLRRWKPTDVELHLVGVIPAEALAGRTTKDISEQVYEMMIADLGEAFRCDDC